MLKCERANADFRRPAEHQRMQMQVKVKADGPAPLSLRQNGYVVSYRLRTDAGVAGPMLGIASVGGFENDSRSS